MFMELKLERYLMPVGPIPPRVEAAIARGVIAGAVPGSDQAPRLLAGPGPVADEVRRAPDGRVLVTCATERPGVTPAMVDWWFGWHLPSGERYRLWHPSAHIAASVKDDRSGRAGDPASYRNNISYVDEYIGRALTRLA